MSPCRFVTTRLVEVGQGGSGNRLELISYLSDAKIDRHVCAQLGQEEEEEKKTTLLKVQRAKKQMLLYV